VSAPPFGLWLEAFAWTCGLELPVYTAVLRHRFRRPWHAALLSLGLQICTHPALWYLAPRFSPYRLWLVTMETSVTLVEGLLVALVLRFRPTPMRAIGLGLLASFLANVFSTLVGLWLFS
jgi:hypothetical protein